MAKVFKGANVFMSRNLVPPELFDALHDALKLNGAQVFLCCDPSRNAPNDYHVIASGDHEKFVDLRSKGCNLLGPQCLLSCAKEHRSLPNQGFTCCLAMDGVNILVSGFEKDEKVEIEKLVTAMGGVLQTRASSDVSFVIVKNVLAQKYKWALNNLKKPIVTINWLHQCWKEHRVVPQESYRVLPFSGLTICVSGIPADERRQMEKLVVQNGGKYSAELTKRCTHLICLTPEGDKYKVAKRWGHINIIARKWFDQSVLRRACLNEESYPVLASSASSVSTLKTVEQHSQDKSFRNSQHTSSSMATVSDSEANLSTQPTETNLENPLQHTYSTVLDAPTFTTKENEFPAEQRENDAGFDRCVADDSESGDDDLYLSECKILLVGFEASELRKLVDMVRRGGGSRYMSFSEKLTHVVVGNPSEMEIKEVRSLAAIGVIYVVKPLWLQESCCEKKEIPVLQRHIAYDLLLPKDPVFFNKATATSMDGMQSGKSSASPCLFADGKIQESVQSGSEVSLAKLKVQNDSSHGNDSKKSSSVFKRKLFRFSNSFPEAQRPEIVEWVNQGGGEMVADQNEKNVHFIVERHGVVPCQTDIMSTYVSSHWVHSCLEAGCLLDVGSHILYSPLPCQIPLPGFEGYRLCVSRYDMKERQLLRNLCFVLGVKFVEKLTKKVSHLLCKFAGGDKYEAACKWGIQLVTAEWIYECVVQNKVVDPNPFYPKEPSSQDQEAGLCNVSQYPSQSFRMISEDDASQFPSESRDIKNMKTVTSTRFVAKEEAKCSSSSKRARLLANDSIKHSLSYASTNNNSVHMKNATENNVLESSREFSSAVPDVAAAIEDLLEQTSKIQDHKSPEASGCSKNTFPSESTRHGQGPADSHSDLEPKHWINRFDEKYDNSAGDAAAKEVYDGFSETQTESQVVGYEEDLSGRQMIIDRVRTRSMA
ncbi:DNA topoisomerase 2-binding protein 1 isoform X2 [Olea europaea var. sylvestris]|uniref:DNA topoisomerase 2-binding protein 1 isoform X2 n=1 Tax=Olea europaea var. sylvestris TaxID=158386 RepID=UPI000C1CCEEC|nr:DNA topoisomerase 2-binding protein 1 isoform X2 [Olea europaea var. sylvestris]